MALERIQSIKYDFDRIGGLLVYELSVGDRIEVGIHGESWTGEPTDQERLITAELKEVQTGGLQVVEDNGNIANWSGRPINFGSYTYSVPGLTISSPGLLRGFIQPGRAVVVDLGGEHFQGKTSYIVYLSASYSSLAVNEVPFFSRT